MTLERDRRALLDEAGSRTGSSAGVVVLADMLFASRVRATGSALGVGVESIGRPDRLLETVRRTGARLVLIDLELRSGDAAGAVRQLRSAPDLAGVRVVGFASHVNSEAIEAGRAAGADRVLARSAFVSKLPELLLPPAESGE